MILLKQSTAATLRVGPFMDATNGVTPETGVTLGAADQAELLKATGATVDISAATFAAVTGVGGWYDLSLTTSHTDTLGMLTVVVQDESVCTPVFVRAMVIPAVVYDALVAGSDNLDVSVTQFGGTNGTFASGIPQVSLSTSAINSVADQVWDEASSGHVAAGSFGAATHVIRSATAQAGASTTITLDASASAVDDFYNNQRISIVAGTGVGQGRIISDYNGTTKVATVSSWATNPSSDSVFVILPFGSIPGASAPTASEVADAVWDEARTDHATAGTFGQSAQVIRTGTAQGGGASTITLDASASATNDLYNYNVIEIISGTGAGQARQITDYVGSSKVATVGLAWTTQPSTDSVFVIRPLGVDAATTALIADAVWDEARADHAAAGSFGEYTRADAVRLSGDATAADNAESFFDGTGYAGTNNVIPNVTTVGSVSGAVGSVTGAVGSVTGSVGGNVAGSVGSVTGAVGSVTGNVGGNVTGSVGSLGATALTAINAEVVDALNVDTYAEPGQGTPPATASIAAKVGYLYKGWRNRKTQTSSQFSLYNDDATTVGQKATVSDNGTTADVGEIATGP